MSEAGTVRELQEQLRITREALVQSEQMAVAGQFAVTVLHEINNPLEAITNFIYLIGSNAGDKDHVRDYACAIEEQLATLRGIAQTTLSFYRDSSRTKPVDLVKIAEAALRIHYRRITQKRLVLTKRLPETLLAPVHSGEMLQMISNLIINAIDALDEEGNLHVRARRIGGSVHLMITDNGHGIPKENLDRIFDPFFTTKKDKGTGIGLALAKSIVERHNGRIRARSCSEKGHSGTTFRITLPLGAQGEVPVPDSRAA